MSSGCCEFFGRGRTGVGYLVGAWVGPVALDRSRSLTGSAARKSRMNGSLTSSRTASRSVSATDVSKVVRAGWVRSWRLELTMQGKRVSELPLYQTQPHL